MDSGKQEVSYKEGVLGGFLEELLIEERRSLTRRSK
jgi:hypothetical protein